MFTTLIFDLDGVVADTHAIHKRAWRQLLREHGQEVSDEELDFVLEGYRREDILRHFLSCRSEEELHRCGERKNELFFHHSNGGVPTVAGVLDFLDDADNLGKRKALATSASRVRTERLLEQLGLSGRFDAVVTADDVMAGKPNPAVFCVAEAMLSASPGTSVVFEDSSAGIRAAKAAGMVAIGIASGALVDRLYEAGADHVIANFCGLSVERLEQLFLVSGPSLHSGVGH